jgi:outer membrane protein assembly factor BamB
MSPRRWSWSGLALVALLAAPGVARAAVRLTAAVPSFDAPFSNAVTAWGTASSLTITVTNTGDQAAHRVDFQLPNANYTSYGGTAPSADWSVTTFTNSGVGVVRFYTACTSAGLAPGASISFVVRMTTPQGATATDTTTSPIQITASTRTNASRCGATASGTASVTAAVKALYLTGAAAPAQGLGAPMTGVVTWTVVNRSSAAQSSVTVVPVVSPATGASGACTTIPSLASQDSGTVTCTYALSASGTYSFSANARNGAGTATAVGASAGTITVGTSSVAWSKAVMARGRPASYTLGLTVRNVSGTTVTRVDLTNPSPAGFALSTASATSGLAYAPGSSSAADVVFTGSLAAGATSALSVTFSAVPAITSTTSYVFGVRLTPAAGGAYAMTTSRQVILVVPISEVAGLTIQASAAGQALAWTNTSAHGSTHDGLVIFRAPAGTDPAFPADFTTYAAGSGGVVFADGAGGTATAFTDADVGSFNYRVCNRDAYHVYSDCSAGFWNGEGWLDSQAYPIGGWVHAVAGSALARPGVITGGRFGLANNGPAVTVVDIPTGARSFAPVALSAPPTAYTPAVILDGGEQRLYAADQSGRITAIDLADGSPLWHVDLPGELFTAGVSGITRRSAAAAFAAAYPMDILLIGSTSGRVYALNALTGATLWSFSAGAGIYSLLTYDPLTNIFYVPTAGAGVLAYSLAGSSPSVAPTPAPGWTNPEPAGLYRLTCVRTAASAGIACLNTSGVLRVMDKVTGALQAPAYATAIPAPTGLARVTGSAATPGLVVSSASQLQILTATGTPYAIASAGVWSPAGVTLSTPSIYGDRGFLLVGGSDRRLHRISLAGATEQAQSSQVGTQNTGGIRLGQPVLDADTGRCLFGTSDGHIWALPSF